MLWIYYQALNEMVQPDANTEGRMRNIRLMTPKVGHAIMVYHAYVCGKVASLLDQIERLEQRKSVWQRVKEWFRK
jgi:hypothetical protein